MSNTMKGCEIEREMDRGFVRRSGGWRNRTRLLGFNRFFPLHVPEGSLKKFVYLVNLIN